MKFEVDLNDILGDEYGAETLQDSVRRQVVERVTAYVEKGVKDQINAAVSETITQQLQAYVTDKMPEIGREILETEYTPVGRWGEKAEPTTFHKELLKVFTEQMVYKKTQYSSDSNAFTKTVDSAMEKALQQFKVDYQKQVDAQFTHEALTFAVTTLKKKLGIA